MSSAVLLLCPQVDADEMHRVCALDVHVRERSKVDILRTGAHTLCTAPASPKAVVVNVNRSSSSKQYFCIGQPEHAPHNTVMQGNHCGGTSHIHSGTV